LTFTSNEVDLCRLLIHVCTLCFLFSTLEAGRVVVDKGNKQVAVSLRNHKIIETCCSGICRFGIYFFDQIDV